MLVEVGLEELDLVRQPEVGGVGAQMVEVREQARPLTLEEVGAVVGVEGVAACGLAKSRLKGPPGAEEKTRTEERVFLPNRKNPVTFRQNSPALFVLQRARDEAHRFGIEHHRKLRRGRNLRSALEELPGIGPTRARQILREWKSLKRLREASREDLLASASIPRPIAETLWRFFHGEEDQRAERDG